MRPLIEILEDERNILQRLESVYRFMLRDDDVELLTILHGKKENLERDLEKTRGELREYVVELIQNDK